MVWAALRTVPDCWRPSTESSGNFSNIQEITNDQDRTEDWQNFRINPNV